MDLIINSYVIELAWIVGKIMLVVGPLLIAVAYLTLAERRVIGFMQLRKGPNVVGPFGMFQPFADALKLMAKETILPAGANKVVFWEDAVEGMRIGGERRVLVPPSAKLRLKDASQRELVSEDDTVRFDIVCLGLETGFSEWQIRNGISGAAGDGGRKIRFAAVSYTHLTLPTILLV